MAYVTVRGGEQTIEESLRRLRYECVKKGAGAGVDQTEQDMWLLVDQVMSEGSLYAPSLAALAIKQGEDSMGEAVFLLRSYRSTLPRRYCSHITDSREMEVERRVSAASKDIPQGQLLGTSHGYVHRLLDFDLLQEHEEELKQYVEAFLSEKCTKEETDLRLPKVNDYLRGEGLLPPVESDSHVPKDATKQMFSFPTQYSEHLQVLSRGTTQAVTALGYASLRSYGVVHPTVGELHVGQLPINVPDPLQPERKEDSCYIGEIKVTEAESLIPITITDPNGEKELEFRAGCGITMGQNETKAITMSILDTRLENEDKGLAVNDEEFVLYHIDAIEATDSISHLKPPHYVTFQLKLNNIRKAEKEQADDGKEIQFYLLR